MGNGEKPADVNRDEDGTCLAGGAIRMDSESSSQGKRKADNHQVKLPSKRRRFCLAGGAIRMDSESSSQGIRKADNHEVKLPSKKRRFCLAGGAIRMDSESSSQGKRKADNHQVKLPAKKRRSQDEDNLFLTSDWDGSVEVFKVGNDLSQPDIFVDPEFVWDGPVEVFKVGNDLSQPDIFVEHCDGVEIRDGPFQVLKSGCDMDCIDKSEMKCDSEGLNAAKGSNEMAGELISWGQSRKARCSGPFVE